MPNQNLELKKFAFVCEAKLFELKKHCLDDHTILGFTIHLNDFTVEVHHQYPSTHKLKNYKSKNKLKIQFVEINKNREFVIAPNANIDDLKLGNLESVFFSAFRLNYMFYHYKQFLFTKYIIENEYSILNDGPSKLTSLKCEGLNPRKMKKADMPNGGSGSGSTYGSPIPPEHYKGEG